MTFRAKIAAGYRIEAAGKLPAVGTWWKRKGSKWEDNELVKIVKTDEPGEDDAEQLGYVTYVGLVGEDGQGSATSFLNHFSKVTNPPPNKKASMEHFDKEQS